MLTDSSWLTNDKLPKLSDSYFMTFLEKQNTTQGSSSLF